MYFIILFYLACVCISFFICWAPFNFQRLFARYVSSGEDMVQEPTENRTKEKEIHRYSNNNNDNINNNNNNNKDNDSESLPDMLESDHGASDIWMDNMDSFDLQMYLYFIVGILYYFTTTINPVIYNLTSAQFRRAFKQEVSRCFKRSRPNGHLNSTKVRARRNSTCVVVKGMRKVIDLEEAPRSRESQSKEEVITPTGVKKGISCTKFITINQAVSTNKEHVIEIEQESSKKSHTHITIKPLMKIKIEFINSEKNSVSKHSKLEASDAYGVSSGSIKEKKESLKNPTKQTPSKTESSIVKSERSDKA